MTNISSPVWVQMTVTKKPSWSDLTLSATGVYIIYICIDSIEESISDTITKIKLPAVTSTSNQPSTSVVKLNRLDRIVTLKGSIKKQDATIAGVVTEIDAKTAKNILIDLFRLYDQPYLQWSGFKNNSAEIVVEKMTFSKNSSNLDRSTSTDIDANESYSVNANLIIGTRKNLG